MSHTFKPGYKQTEVGVIPEEWEVKMLSAVSSMKSGEGITASRIDEHSRYPCYGGNGLRGFTSRYTHDGSFALIGRQGALCGNVVGVTGKIFASEHAVVVTPRHDTDIQFLTYVLGEMHLNRLSEASAQPGLSVSKILQLSIPIPTSKTEQRAIATALSDVDALLAALDRLIAKQRDLKQAAMQQLLTGQTRLPGFRANWIATDFDSLCRSFTKQTGFDYSASIKRSLTFEDKENSLPFIQNKDFSGSSTNYNTDYFIPESVALNFPRILLDERCFLISISGRVGNVGVFSNKRRAFVGGAVAVAKFKDARHLDWVMFYLQSNEGQNILLSNVKAGSHQNLILDDLRKIEIPLPPLEEQTAIATVLSDMDLELAALEQRRDKTRALKQGMMQELLTGRTRLV